MNALTGENNNLVIRTNFVGFNKKKPRPGFSEWLFKSLENKKKLFLFDDYFHSPIYVEDLVKIIFMLIEKNASGIFNVASRDVISKLEFCKKIFKKLKIRPDFSLKSVKTLDVKRANNNGLDISKVENFLSIKLPNTTNTAECIVNDYMKIKKII